MISKLAEKIIVQYLGCKIDIKENCVNDINETRIVCLQNYDKETVYKTLDDFLKSPLQQFIFCIPTSYLFSKTKFYSRFTGLIFDKRQRYLDWVIFLPKDAVFPNVRSTLLILDKRSEFYDVNICNGEDLSLKELENPKSVWAIQGIKRDLRDIVIDGETLYKIGCQPSSEENVLTVDSYCEVIHGCKNDNNGTELEYISCRDFPMFGYADHIPRSKLMVSRFYERSLLKANDILFSFVSSVGACCLFPSDFSTEGIVATGNQVILRIRDEKKNECTPEALLLYLKSDKAVEWIQKHTISKYEHTPSRMLIRSIRDIPVPEFSAEDLQNARIHMQELQDVEKLMRESRETYDRLVKKGKAILRKVF